MKLCHKTEKKKTRYCILLVYLSHSSYPTPIKQKIGTSTMRAFWTIFFLGSMLLVGINVFQRRQDPLMTHEMHADNDPAGIPTPRPGN